MVIVEGGLIKLMDIYIENIRTVSLIVNFKTQTGLTMKGA